jgi:hypothetical protein
MTYNIGLNVIEVDGPAAPAIPAAATSVAAFNILTRRGVPNSPARVTTFSDFVDRFGGFFTGGVGAYLVKGFFDNGGGVAYCNRVASSTASPASITLDDAAGATLKLEGGYRGAADPGTWGNDLYIRTTRSSSASGITLRETAKATVTAQTALPATTNLTAGGGIPVLEVEIDGATPPSQIQLQAADFANAAAATPTEIVNAINARSQDVDASLSATQQLALTSTGNIASIAGGLTSLKVTSVAAFGFTATISGAATVATPLAAGATAAQLSRIDGLDVGDAVQVTDGTATEVVQILTIDTLTRAVTWAPALVANFDELKTRFGNLEFGIEVFRGGIDVDQHRVEVWTALSMEPQVPNYVITVLNNPLTGSRWVRAVDELSTQAMGANRPVDLATPKQFGTSGVDGAPTSTDFNGDPVTHTGFFSFDPYAVQLVTCERTDPTIAEAGISYCEGRGDCMYVGAIPDGAIPAGTAVAYGQARQGAKRYGALYGPWILVADPAGAGDNPMITIPPVGHVLGVYARIDRTRGIWKAPAGNEARLRNAIDVTDRFTDAEHTELVKNGVNGIRPVPRAGVVVDASRTLSTDPRWTYVNVRLLFNFVESSLREGLGWVRQEPNKDSLWNVVKFGTVVPFLTGLWRQGAFGTGKPSEVFTVICDATNNPPADVQLGILTVEIYMYPSNPAETIVIKVGQQPSGGLVTES